MVVLVVVIKVVRLQVLEVGELRNRVVNVIMPKVINSVTEYTASKKCIGNGSGANGMKKGIKASDHENCQSRGENKAHSMKRIFFKME
jgi:hypothetical protein